MNKDTLPNKREIPAIHSRDEIVFSRLGENEDIDIVIDREPRFKVMAERIFWNEEKEEWDGREIPLFSPELGEELKDYLFVITNNGAQLSFKEIKDAVAWWDRKEKEGKIKEGEGSK